MVFSLQQAAREWRHNPCLMTPLSVILLLTLCLGWMLLFVIKFPALILGLLLAPLLTRAQLIIEHVYPLSMGRVLHLWMLRMIQRAQRKGHGTSSLEASFGFHSRAMETRIQIVPDRVYLHVLPQLLDNLGYLLVCLPESTLTTTHVTEVQQVESNDSSAVGRISVATTTSNSEERIVALLVDCGDAQAVKAQLRIISDIYYAKKQIHVQSILSTHKHHDHTAGNRDFRQDPEIGSDLKIIVGGAVERVPECNFPVADGDFIPLPKYASNRMEDHVEIEAVATPGHTRGSIVYILRPKATETSTIDSAAAFLFTGDTMFSAGGGVPFEADFDPYQESKDHRLGFNAFIQASASGHAVERCFAQLLARTLRREDRSGPFQSSVLDRTHVLPGHEYSVELLARQFTTTTESCKWRNLAPSHFFETAAQYWVAVHRRGLPHTQGKLLSAVGSPMRRELLINPNLRSLSKRGEIVLNAVEFWHRNFARDRILDNFLTNASTNGMMTGVFETSSTSDAQDPRNKAPSTPIQWNLDSVDLGQSVFTTVFASELDRIIADLQSGNVSAAEAARRLSDMKKKPREPLIGRRPIPGTLPSDRAVYRGLLGFALLGSPPTAMTTSDSRRMKLPPPIGSSSDRIKVSCSRLICVLQWLGVIRNNLEGNRYATMIRQLWKEALEDSLPLDGRKPSSSAEAHDTSDVEQNEHAADILELGDLKWTLYGIPRKQSSALRCLPCAKPQRLDIDHPAYKSGMKPHSGELIRHDIYACPVCRVTTGCLHQEASDQDFAAMEPVTSTMITRYGSTISEDEQEGFIEVTSLLKEA